jgi:hypothetical protein
VSTRIRRCFRTSKHHFALISIRPPTAIENGDFRQWNSFAGARRGTVLPDATVLLAFS